MIKLKTILTEDLRAWFGSGGKGGVGGGGWDRYNSSGDRIGKCGDADKGDAYSACLSKDKAAKLGKAGRASFVKRKRAAQKKGGDAKKGGEQSKGQKTIKVKTGANEEMTPQQYQQKGMPFKGKANVSEAKQVGIIYHYTTFEAGLKILQSNQLKSSDAADSTNTKLVFAVSFTRDKRFHDNHVVGFDESSIGNKPQLRFTIDGNNLSNKFKVQPYSQQGAFSKNRKGFEAEERVIANKPFTIPLYDYLMSVDVLLEYKKTSDKYDILSIVNYEMYAPLRAKIIKFAQSKNLPINLIINKNGDPWPDKVKESLIQKILNWFKPKKGKTNIVEQSKGQKSIKVKTSVNEADPQTGSGKKPKGSSRRLYTDENPSDTVSIKFKTKEDIADTLGKGSFTSKSHKRQSQIINLIHQRVRAAYQNAKDPDVKSRLKRGLDYIETRKEASKKKTQQFKIKTTSEEMTPKESEKIGMPFKGKHSRKLKENLDPKTFKDTGKSAPYGSGYSKIKELEERLNLFLEKNVPTNPSKWSYYVSQAKKKFDVYPSAYANGWAAKQYKAAGGGWKKGK